MSGPGAGRGDSLVTVAGFGSVVEAEGVRGVLLDAGIEAFVADGNLLSVDPLLGPALGGVGLQVRRSDSERALELIREHETSSRKEAAEGTDPERAESTCISCGAEFPEYLERCPSCGLDYG